MLVSPTYYHERKERCENMYKHYRKYNLTSLFQEPEILTCFFSLNVCTNSPINLSSQGFLYRLILSKVRSVSVLVLSLADQFLGCSCVNQYWFEVSSNIFDLPSSNICL